MSWFRRYLEYPIIYKILIGFVLGIVIGAIIGEPIAAIKPLGDLFIILLKMVVAPIILFSLVIGAASITPARLGKVGVKIIVYYLVTSAVAVVIGILMANVFRPGVGLQLAGEAKEATVKPPPMVEVLLGIIPTNPFATLMQGKVLQIIFFAIVLGIAIAYLRKSIIERVRTVANTVYQIFDGLAECMYKIVRGILQYAPIGVFALIGYVVAKYGPGIPGPLAIVVIALYVGLFIHIFLIYGGILGAFKLSILTFLKGARKQC